MTKKGECTYDFGIRITCNAESEEMVKKAICGN